MASKFIYVFSVRDKKALEDLGLQLMKEDPSTAMYIFLNDGKMAFCDQDISYIASDTLTF